MDLDRRLRELAADRSSGAVALAVTAIDLAQDWAACGRDLEELAASLAEIHKSIATIQNLARRIRQGSDENLGALRTALVEGNVLISKQVARIVPPGRRLITISNSSTVLAALSRIEPAHVVCLQSLPGGEGAALAEAAEQALGADRVGLEPDAAMGKLVDAVDLALVGVDSFDAEGALVHKVGTLPLALCCRAAGIPFYAAGHSFKRLPDLIRAQPDEPIFDRTPAELVSAIITESG